MISGQEPNFAKYESYMLADLTTSYDYDSIMHYSAYHFTKNGEKTVISPGPAIGQRDHLSVCDVEKIQMQYGCISKVILFL